MARKIEQIWEAPLIDIHSALREGDVSARALGELAIRRHGKSEAQLNAYKLFDADGIARQAGEADRVLVQGAGAEALTGLPISIKDLYGVEGLPVFAGSKRELPQRWQTEGPIVSEIRRQKGVITGKSHTVEFAIGALGSNDNWGTPRNPWDAEKHRVPGGSSSGAGVSLAQGSALVAFGSDTAGSIRAPASMTGAVGYKPTFGRWSTEGIVPLSSRLDSPGPLTRSAADLNFVFDALDPGGKAASERDLQGLRIGLCDRYFWDDCSPGIEVGVHRALTELEAAGAVLSEVEITLASEAMEIQKMGSLVGKEFADFIVAELPEWEPLLDPPVRSRLDQARKMPADAFQARVDRVMELQQLARTYFTDCDVLALPTLAVTPPTLEEIATPEGYQSATVAALRNCCIANLFGFCAVTLPVALDKAGMPVGLQLMAPGGNDAALIAIACAVESTLGAPLQRIGRPPLGYSA